MSSTWTIAIISLVIIIIAPVLLSYVIEAFRSTPATPTRLTWAPEVAIRYSRVGNINLRYIMAGQGPPLLLLHTLRTQLDIFNKIIPELSQHFQVYALDYPGHGYSDIPAVEYTPEFFTTCISAFLETMDIKDAIVVGESIGGSISLLLASKPNPRVKKIVSINPYDYDKGRGVLRSSWVAKALFTLNDVPLIGSTFWRFRTLFVFRMILRGGVYHSDAITPKLSREMHEVGNRPYHYKAFMSLIHHFREWENVRSEYEKIEIPVCLIYGDHDWSRPDEQEATQKSIPGAKITIVKDAGHFLSLDMPAKIVKLILDFASSGGKSEGSKKNA